LNDAQRFNQDLIELGCWQCKGYEAICLTKPVILTVLNSWQYEQGNEYESHVCIAGSFNGQIVEPECGQGY
jgi:hypothetical protein